MNPEPSQQTAPRPQRAQRDGVVVTAAVLESGLDVDNTITDWLDVDGVTEGDHRVRLDLANGSNFTLGALGATHDRFMAELRTARRRVRFAALTIATGDPLVTYTARPSVGIIDVHLYAKVLVAEPREGQPIAVPLSLIEKVERNGYEVTVVGRGLEPLALSLLGVKTDEFLERLSRARRDLQVETSAAYAAYDEGLTGFTAPDGWAMTANDAGAHWATLESRARGGSRAQEVGTLAGLAGDALAIGIYTDGGASPLPFVLAPVGDRIVVEATDGDDRATFVFRGLPLDRLNAVLILTSFRREALFLPDDQLGRWAVAVRTWPVVREARAALTARIVHDAHWDEALKAALH